MHTYIYKRINASIIHIHITLTRLITSTISLSNKLLTHIFTKNQSSNPTTNETTIQTNNQPNKALQRDMNNVSVTTVPISTLRNSIFNICFAPAKVGNHTFSMTLQTSGGSGLQGGSFGGSNFIGRPPQVGPMHIHQLVANVTCSRYDGQLVSNDIYNGLTNAFYLIFSISVPDHPSIPTKSQKWKSFIISPNTRGGPSFNDECLGWLTTSIR